MKGLNKYASLILALLAISGCAKDELEDETTPQPSSPKKEWYSIVKTDTISSAQISYIISGQQIPIGNNVVRMSFLYHSINDYDTLTLSGAVCWPVNKGTASTIWLDNHYTTTRWDQCPSQDIMPILFLSTMKSVICVAPDYQGLGLSTELQQPYFNSVLLATQSIDCMKAALSLLHDYGPTLTDDFKTYNSGYSLGGAVSMGVARKIEADAGLQSLIHLKKSFCGDGPYDQMALFEHFTASPEQHLDYPLEFPCALLSVLYSSPEFAAQYNYQDIFSEKLISCDILDSINSKLYDTEQINLMFNKAGCATLKDQLSEDLLNPESDIFKAFRREIQKLDLTKGWSPSIPILFCHSTKDSVVPIECLESIKQNMKDNPNITYHILTSGDHWLVGIEFYKNLFLGQYSLD